MNESKLDDLARRLLEGLPPAVRGFGADLETQFRAVLRANLGRLDLVARDEFDAQTKVLARTRTLIEQLERRIAALEAGGPASAAAAPASNGAAEAPSAGR